MGYILLIVLQCFLAIAPWFYGLTRFKDQLIAEVILFSICLICIPFLDSRKFAFPKIRHIDGWVMFSLVLSFIYVLVSKMPYQSFLSFLRFLSCVLFYWLIRNVVTTDKRVYSFLWVILFVGFFYSIYGIFQYQGIIPSPYWYEADSLAARYVNGGHFGPFLFFSVWSGVCLFFVNRRRWAYAGLICLFLLPQILALCLTKSRTSWLVFIFGIIFFMCAGGKYKIINKKFLLGLILIGTVGGFLLLKLGVVGTVADRIQTLWKTERFYSLNFRGNLWHACFLAMVARPWGWGIGTFSFIFPVFKVHSDRFFIEYAHNEFLQIGTDFGVLGVVFLLTALVFYFRKIFLLLNDTRVDFQKRLMALCLAAMFVSLFFASQTDFPLRIYASALFFFLFLALSAYIFDFRPKSFAEKEKERGGVSARFYRIPLFILLLSANILAAKQLLAQIYFEKAEVLDQSLSWDDAQKGYEMAIRLAPLYAPYYEGIASLLKRRGDLPVNRTNRMRFLDETIHAYREAVRLQPYSALDHYLLASLYEEQGNMSQAKAYYQKAISLEPQNALYVSEFGYFASKHAMIDEMVNAFEKLKHISFQEHLRIYGCDAVQMTYNLTKDYNNLKRVTTNDWQGHHCLGVVLGKGGDWKLARKELNAAITQGEKEYSYDAFLNQVWQPIADFYLQYNQFHDALMIYREALIKQPDNNQLRLKVNQISEKIGTLTTTELAT